jgi:hypothetical protein
MKNFDLKWIKRPLILVAFFSISFTSTIAQISDSLYKPKREFKNTIRFNVTNPLIFGGQSIIFGYERQLKNNRSFSINIGKASLSPFNFLDNVDIKAKTILNESGFHVSGDYRFYLSKLNKYNAPRGVYIGPYYSYNTFDKKHAWDYTKDGITKTIETDLNININTVGFELGYQFVFWKRFSVDMILIGPGVAGYNLKAIIGGNLSDAERQEFIDLLNEALKDKFPGYSGLNIDGEFLKKGTVSATSVGLRYMINVGYRF